MRRFLIALGLVPLLVLGVWFATSERDGPAPAAPDAPEVGGAGTGREEGELAAPGTGDPVRRAGAAEAEEAAVQGAGATGAGERALLRGTVLDAGGEPAAGASVVVRSDREPRRMSFEDEPVLAPLLAEGRTDSEGRFALDIGTRVGVLVVRHTGHAPARVQPVHAGEDRVVRLVRGARLAGDVVTEDDGLPVRGARVQLARQDAPLEEQRADAGGLFLFEDLPPGEYFLSAWSEDLGLCAVGPLELDPGTQHEKRLELPRGFVLTGRVTDAWSGAPVEGAVVGEGFVVRKSVRTDANGRYRLAGVGGGAAWGLQVVAEGYGRLQHRFLEPLDGDREIDLRLLPSRSARGRVVDGAGEPLAGVHVTVAAHEVHEQRVRMDWLEARTGPDGEFVVEGLRCDAPHALHLRKPGYGTVTYDFPPTEDLVEPFPIHGFDAPAISKRRLENPVVDLGTLTLTGGLAISGRVVDEQGRPIEDASVTVTGHNADRYALSGTPRAAPQGYLNSQFGWSRTRSSADGTFRVADLAPGTYSVAAYLGDHAGFDESQVDLDADVTDLTLTLVLGFAIEGRVTDGADRGLATVLVRLYREGLSEERLVTEFTDADGSFLVRGLEAGTYTLRLDPQLTNRNEGTQLGPLERVGVAAGTSGLWLRLPRLVEVTGTVVDEGGDPVPGAEVELESDVWSPEAVRADAEGRFTVLAVEDVSSTVRATMGEGGRSSERVSVLPPRDGLRLTLR